MTHTALTNVGTFFYYFFSEDDFWLLVFRISVLKTISDYCFFLFFFSLLKAISNYDMLYWRIHICFATRDLYIERKELEILLTGSTTSATIVCLFKVEIYTSKRFCYCDFYTWHFVTKSLCYCLLFCWISVFWFLLTFWIILIPN